MKMKLKAKPTVILLLALLATLNAAETNGCTSDACGYCEKLGEAKFCTLCHGKPMSGKGTSRKCEGGTPITGCLEYRSDHGGNIFCSACDTSKNYLMFNNGEHKNNSCLLCDVSTSYLDLDTGTCKARETLVDGCAAYEPYVDEC